MKRTDRTEDARSVPAVHFRAVVWSASDDFRRRVERTAAKGRQEPTLVENVGQTEIRNLPGNNSKKAKEKLRTRTASNVCRTRKGRPVIVRLLIGIERDGTCRPAGLN